MHRYHTPLDDLENLSRASLQHHAQNALQAIRGLDAAPNLAAPPRGDAVFFDLFGRRVPHVSARTARLVAWGTLVLTLVAIGRALRSGGARPGRLLVAIGVMLAVLVLGAAGGTLERLLMGRLGLTSEPWPAYIAPIVVGVAAASIGVFVLAATAMRRIVLAREATCAVLLMHASLGAAVAWVAPGASYLQVIPATLLAMLLFTVWHRGDIDAGYARVALPALALSALMVAPLQAGVIDAFGVSSALPIAAPILLVATFLVPLVIGSTGEPVAAAPWVGATGIAVALLGAAFVGTLDDHTRRRPGKLNLTLWQDGEEVRWEARTLRGRLGDGVADALGIQPTSSLRRGPWTGRLAGVGDVESNPGLAAPSITELARTMDAKGGTVATFRVASARRDHQLVVAAAGATALHVAGRRLPFDEEERPGSWRGPVVALLGAGDQEFTLDVEFSPDDDVELVVIGKRFGFDARSRQAARPRLERLTGDFVPWGDGHGTLAVSRLALTKMQTAEPTR